MSCGGDGEGVVDGGKFYRGRCRNLSSGLLHISHVNA